MMIVHYVGGAAAAESTNSDTASDVAVGVTIFVDVVLGARPCAISADTGRATATSCDRAGPFYQQSEPCHLCI